MKKTKIITTLLSLAISTSAAMLVATSCADANRTNSNADINDAISITGLDWVTRSALTSQDREKIRNGIVSDNGMVFAEYRDLKSSVDINVNETKRETVGEQTTVTFSLEIDADTPASGKYYGKVTWSGTYTYSEPIPTPPEEKITISVGITSNLNFYDTQAVGTITVVKGDQTIPLTGDNLVITLEDTSVVDYAWDFSKTEDNLTIYPKGLGFAKLTVDYKDGGEILATKDVPISVDINDITPITYETALNYMSNNQLVPDKKYQITDYKATVNNDVAKEGIAAWNVGKFDLVLTAWTTSKFYNECYAALNSFDVQYVNTDLEAWNILYDINNDRTKYSWADDSVDGNGKPNGRGVIYSLTDENSNTIPYDFKSIKFSNKFTFNGERESDASLSKRVIGNTINPYIETIDGNNTQILNNIVFDLGLTGTAVNNTFANDCADITLGANCSGNDFGNECYDIALDPESSLNTFGNGCNCISTHQQGNNIISQAFVGNTFNDFCSDIVFDIAKWDGNSGTQKYCAYNSFLPGISSITVSNIEFSNNTVHQGVQDVTFQKQSILDTDIYPTEDIISWSDPVSVPGTDIEVNGNTISYFKGTKNGQFTIEASDEVLPVSNANGLIWIIEYLDNATWKTDSMISASLGGDNKTLTITIDKAHDTCENTLIKVKCTGAAKTVNDFTTTLNVSAAQNKLTTTSNAEYQLADEIDPNKFVPNNDYITLPLNGGGTQTFDVNTIETIHLESFNPSVISIQPNFMDRFENLESVEILNIDKVTSIDNCFINQCGSLRSINLSGFVNVTNIGALFLSGCTSLKSIDLSPFTKVKNVGGGFLALCTDLKTIDFSPMVSLEDIGDGFMMYCYQFTTIDLSPLVSLKTIGNEFLNSCWFLESVDFSGLTNLTSIGDKLLYYGDSLESVNFGNLNNVTSIGDNFLSGCVSLTSLDLSSFTGVTSIGNYFLGPDPLNTNDEIEGCVRLTDIDISGFTSVKTIGDSFLGAYATYETPAKYKIELEGCMSLKSINLSAFTNVTSVGDRFLFGCKEIKTVDLSAFPGADPDASWTGGTQFGNDFLSECWNLTTINFGGVAANQIPRSESPIALPQPFVVSDTSSTAALDGLTLLGQYIQAVDATHYIRGKFGELTRATDPWNRKYAGPINRMIYGGVEYKLADDIDPNSFISTSTDGRYFIEQEIELKDRSKLVIQGNEYSWSLLTSLTLANYEQLRVYNIIYDFFLYKCYNLQTIELSGLVNISQILSGFCANTALTFIDLSALTEVYNIGLYFLAWCVYMQGVWMDRLTKLTNLGSYYLASNYALRHLLAPNVNPQNIEWWFGTWEGFMQGVATAYDIPARPRCTIYVGYTWGDQYDTTAPWSERIEDIEHIMIIH